MAYVLKRHKVMNILVRPAVWFANTFVMKYKHAKKYKAKKGESLFVVSNHQTDMDPSLLAAAFNVPLYFVGTDSIFSKPFFATVVRWAFNPIPKKKGMADPLCIKNMLRVFKEKGSVALFVEGNRSYAEFQYYIDPGIAKLIKTSNATLVLHKITGGTGTNPRWGRKKRKGKLFGTITKVLKPAEYKELSDEELLSIIYENIKSYDSQTNNVYKSNRRAEYLEKMLFVCPCCNSSQTLVSKGNYIRCNNCGLEVEYTPSLHLKSNNNKFTFDILNDWYQYQKKWVKEYQVIENNTIFEDDEVKLYLANIGSRRKLLSKGPIKLTNKVLSINNYNIDISKIIIASPVSGSKISFTCEDNEYLIKGTKRFNPLKYVFMFNKLETHMKLKNIDKYYNLD